MPRPAPPPPPTSLTRVYASRTSVEGFSQMLGMVLMLGEKLQPGLEQLLQLRILRIRNQRGFDGAVDRAVIGDFVLDVCHVVRLAAELLVILELHGGGSRQRHA